MVSASVLMPLARVMVLISDPDIAAVVACARGLAISVRKRSLTATFADYLLPTARDVPAIAIHHLETPLPLAVIGFTRPPRAKPLGPRCGTKLFRRSHPRSAAPARWVCAAKNRLPGPAGRGFVADIIEISQISSFPQNDSWPAVRFACRSNRQRSSGACSIVLEDYYRTIRRS